MTESSLAAETANEASAAGDSVVPPVPALPPAAVSPPTAATPPALPKAPELKIADDPVAGAQESSQNSFWSELVDHVPSWLASTVMHLSLVLLLALLAGVQTFQEMPKNIQVSAGDGGGDDLENSQLGMPDDLPSGEAISPTQLSELPDATPTVAEMIAPISASLTNPELTPRLAGGSGIAGTEAGAGGGLGGGGGGDGNSFELRLSGDSRDKMLRSGGGTPESEHAVLLALKWLSEHQNYNGSWSFKHQNSPKCHGACDDPGFKPGNVAATSLALLPFLGTGQTHLEGTYKKNIDAGIKFLVHAMEIQGDLGSLHEPGGEMYGHGLAAIVLCEAYGMTHDQNLRTPAQAAINFIVAAQDPVGGGWRYIPGQVGDTSVVGWQMMALKSAQMAYLKVPPQTLKKAGYFLDHVQGERGAVYGYQSPEARRPATTAIGLLCRMYLGWKHEHPPLQHGVQILSQMGPSTDRAAFKNNMYYNYYATQVMHHYGGYPWKRWNEVLREYLIKSQSRRGHEYGSWFLDGADHGASAGGRLYCTAMAAMTLEVYYRHMPLYSHQSTDEVSGRGR